MKAGRELDARVAEEVMGWKVDREAWTVAKPHKEKPDTFWCVPLIEGYWGAWNPSTHIADAWRVVEKLNSDGYIVEIVNDCVAWSVSFTHVDDGKKHVADWKNSPEAQICLAALKAVE